LPTLRSLNTYAIKKYGEDWRDRDECDDIEQEFSDWLDRRVNGGGARTLVDKLLLRVAQAA
jgi:hypothetical protein